MNSAVSKAVYGYFRAQSEGNDVIVYEPGEGSQVRELLRFTRIDSVLETYDSEQEALQSFAR